MFTWFLADITKALTALLRSINYVRICTLQHIQHKVLCNLDSHDTEMFLRIFVLKTFQKTYTIPYSM